MAEETHSTAQFEATDVGTRLLGFLALGVAAFLLAAPYVLLFFYPQSPYRSVDVRPLADFANPRLQVDPPQDLAAVRNAEQQRLATYGWTDRNHNLVHLPIERALAIVTQRGLPGWQQP